MTTLPTLLRPTDTTRGEPRQLRTPYHLPPVPSRTLGTLEAIRAEKLRKRSELVAARRALDTEIRRNEAEIAAVEEDLRDHAANVRCGLFPLPDDAA